MVWAPDRRARATKEAELLALRAEFPILRDSTYLISNSLGAMPRGVYDSLRHYADTWAKEGVYAWDKEWWQLAIEVGDAIAGVIGAPAGSVSTHQNVTVASAVVASCLRYTPERNRIVCSELNFPSIVQLYRAQARYGAELRLVRSPDGLTVPTEAVLEAIDERTLLVPISHVIFKSSYVQEVEAIVARAHEVGAMVALDVYQSAGIMPIDVVGLDVDFALGGVLKWLCGGPGVAYLYVRPDRAEQLEPALTGWFARAAPFAFDAYDESYAAGAWRFLNGTTQIPALSAALPGLRILAGLDAVAVRSKSLRQTGWLLEQARARGWRVNSPSDPARRGGHVTLEVPGAEAIARALGRRRVMVDYRPGAGIRVAPHFYTTDGELEHLVQTIEELLEGGGEE